MGKRTKQSVYVYDKMAAEYDTSPEGHYTRPHKAALLQRVMLRDGDCVLDVACGNGTLLGEFARKANIHAFGVDLSENMIAAARTRCPEQRFAVSACVPLPFEGERMDAITVSCAFHHFEEPQAFAAECMRVLKPGGRLYLAEPFFPSFVRCMANLLWIPFAKSGDVRIYSGKALRKIFARSGFCEITTDENGSVLFFSAKKP